MQFTGAYLTCHRLYVRVVLFLAAVKTQRAKNIPCVLLFRISFDLHIKSFDIKKKIFYSNFNVDDDKKNFLDLSSPTIYLTVAALPIYKHNKIGVSIFKFMIFLNNQKGWWPIWMSSIYFNSVLYKRHSESIYNLDGSDIQ